MRKAIPVLLFICIVLSSCELPGSKKFYAWNYPASQDQVGVTVQVGRVLLAPKGTFKDDGFKTRYFNDKPVIAELIFVVQNHSQQTMNVYPNLGNVVVNGEQVDLSAVSMMSSGDWLGGEILPGVTKIGILWFGFRRSKMDDIQKMSIIIPAPSDNYFNTYGNEYRFELDLSNRQSDPMPEELK